MAVLLLLIAGVVRPTAAPPAADNIRAIVELEHRSRLARTWQERFSDRVAAVAGSVGFVLFHLALFGAWAAWNAAAPERWRFDPYPYGLLTFIVSLEGVLIATFVLITQNRMSRQADARDHLNLQINLLAEQETTVMLRLLRQIGERVGAPGNDPDLRQAERLAEETNVVELMEDIERELPDPNVSERRGRPER